ncbi:MAG: glycosyltransferase [Sphingorhabdus sp.]
MASPLNIMTLSTLFPASSRPNFGIFVERQTSALAKLAGFDATVINPLGVAPWPLSRLRAYDDMRLLPAHERWNGLETYRPRFTAYPKFGGRLNPKMIFQTVLPLAIKLHNERPFDLIDAEFFYPDGPAAMLLSDALGIPFTIKARGADIHHWGRIAGCAEQLLHAADKAAGLLAVSGALKADMAALGIEEGKIMVHYTGLDQARFSPRDRSAEKAKLGIDGPIILCIGALIPRKNQHLLLHALPLLPRATLILAGQGSSEQQYRQLAKTLGVEERVRFHGNVPHDDLPGLLAAADVMALVSESEGLANAWVEALACGTPIIASDVGGIRELITSPHAGHIVDREPHAIAKAIHDMLVRAPDPADVSASVGTFSWDENARQLAAHFRRITNH